MESAVAKKEMLHCEGKHPPHPPAAGVFPSVPAVFKGRGAEDWRLPASFGRALSGDL